LLHRLGIRIEISGLISTTDKQYPDYTVHLQMYLCELIAPRPQARNVRDFKWVTMDEIDKFEFTPADQKAMDALLFGGAQFH